MQRRARLKAMLRHNSSVELISLCRSFWGQGRKWKPVTLYCTEWCSRVCVGGLFVHNKRCVIRRRTYSEVLDDLRIPLGLVLHLGQNFQYIWNRGEQNVGKVQQNPVLNWPESVLYVMTFYGFSPGDLLQVLGHVSCSQWNGGWDTDHGQGTRGRLIWSEETQRHVKNTTISEMVDLYVSVRSQNV